MCHDRDLLFTLFCLTSQILQSVSYFPIWI